MKAETIQLHGFKECSLGTLKNIRLANSNKIEVILTNFGPSILKLMTPDRNGHPENIILGYKTIDGYLNDKKEHGRIGLGRVAGRIADGQYAQPDNTYDAPDGIVDLNPWWNGHTLHSGPVEIRWSYKFWKASEPYTDSGGAHVEFSYTSGHLEQGFPGEVEAKIKVTLTEENELKLSYEATTNRTTPINLTCHGYFNPNGADSGFNITDCKLWTNAKRYLPVGDYGIPTGGILPVRGSTDFTNEKIIGDNDGKGHDVCLAFNGKGVAHWARAYSPLTGRIVGMSTDQNAMIFYSALHLASPFQPFGGLCLEGSNLVNIVNNPKWWKEFGNPFTKAGETYTQETIYRFGTIDKN